MARQKNPARVEAAKKNPWIRYMASKCTVKYKRAMERRKRKISAATKIQAAFRGYASRKKSKDARKRAPVVRRSRRPTKKRRFLYNEQEAF